jgi:hypothetical protein
MAGFGWDDVAIGTVVRTKDPTTITLTKISYLKRSTKHGGGPKLLR